MKQVTLETLIDYARTGNYELFVKFANKIVLTLIDCETITVAAAEHGHIDIVHFVVEECTENDRCRFKLSRALKTGAKNGHLVIVDFLDSRVNESQEYYEDIIKVATSRGHLQIVQYFVETKDLDYSVYQETIGVCVKYKQYEILQYMFKKINSNVPIPKDPEINSDDSDS